MGEHDEQVPLMTAEGFQRLGDIFGLSKAEGIEGPLPDHPRCGLFVGDFSGTGWCGHCGRRCCVGEGQVEGELAVEDLVEGGGVGFGSGAPCGAFGAAIGGDEAKGGSEGPPAGIGGGLGDGRRFRASRDDHDLLLAENP